MRKIGGPRGPLAVWSITPKSFEKQLLSKQDILARFPAIFKRDLELSRSTSEILLRRGCFFLKLGHIRVLVEEREILVFDDNNPIASDFAARLRAELQSSGSSGPIELAVLESALIYSSQNFQNRLALLDPLARRLLRELIASSKEESSLRLIPVKTAISHFHTALVGYRRALDREDLPRHMRVGSSSAAPSGGGHSDLEVSLQILLADYRTRAEEVLGALEDLREEVESVEATITQVLSASRNQLMRLNLRISMVALACGVGSMGFSALGMNLVNGWEAVPGAFQTAVASVGAGAVAAYAVSNVYYRRSNKQFLEVVEDGSFFASINSPNFVHSLFTKDLLEDSAVQLLLHSALGRAVDNEELQRIMSQADSNGDHRVTLSELLDYVSANERD